MSSKDFLWTNQSDLYINLLAFFSLALSFLHRSCSPYVSCPIRGSIAVVALGPYLPRVVLLPPRQLFTAVREVAIGILCFEVIIIC